MSAKNPIKPVWIKFDGDDLVLNTTAMCRLLDVTKMSLSKWASIGCPKEKRGWWKPRDVLLWRKGQFGDDDPENADVSKQKTKQDARWKKARADREELMVGVLSGQYVPTDAVISGWCDRIVEVKQSLLALPGVIAAECAGQDETTIQQIIYREVQSVLAAFARPGEHTPTVDKQGT